MKKNVKSKLGDLRGFNFSVLGIGAGATFNPSPLERDIVLKLITQLADRRILLHGHCTVIHSDMIASLMKMREHITNTLELIPESAATEFLIAMRKKCHAMQNIIEAYNDGSHAPLEADFHQALSGLRKLVGSSVVQLSEIYDIPIESELIGMFQYTQT